MADPNPARGMPAPLLRYWLSGKGAAKIRWGMPHDFDRCVRNLRKYFPKEPEGLCNNLHQKAVGAPPGKGHGHSVEVTDESLVAATRLLGMQDLGESLWAGPIAPIGVPTGEPNRIRVFDPGALRHRVLPLPLAYRKVDAPGHQGAITVGRILGISYGPDEFGRDWAWAWGDWLDETIVPEVSEARYMVSKGVTGPSVDPGGRVVATVDPATQAEHTTEYTIGRVTLVSIPAFPPQMSGSIALGRLYNLSEEGDWPDGDLDMEDYTTNAPTDCGCDNDFDVSGSGTNLGQADTYTINPAGWRGLPLAPRDSVFDNDDAVLRIGAWAGIGSENVDIGKLRRAFMWRDPRLPETATQSYRLPVGDIINGKLTLVFHAIYAAAALLSGAHGGLPAIPEPERGQLKKVISDIYRVMATEFGDNSIQAPWDRAAAQANFAADTGGAVNLVEPPVSWFDNPKLARKTPLTVTPEGRVYGHLAAWNECHRDIAARECVLAPRSRKNYAPFKLGTVVADSGETIPVGKIVMDTRHADIRLGYTATALHYDNTGDEVAVVTVGEDEYGIWLAGSVVPEATPAKIAKLRRSPLSGDWRRVDGNLELIAALAVNVPAFPVYSMENDERTALIAAGTVWEPFWDMESEPESELVDSLVAATVADVETNLAQEDRAWRLRALLEQEEDLLQRDRAARLAHLYAVVTGETPPREVLVPTGQVASDDMAMMSQEAMLARQADAKFTIIEDTAEIGEKEGPGKSAGPDAAQSDAATPPTQQPTPPVTGA